MNFKGFIREARLDDRPDSALKHLVFKSQDDLKKITTKFFRADQSRNSETGGHGLGLAIVDKLLSKNGHKLEFSSTLGKGSSFIINISLS